MSIFNKLKKNTEITEKEAIARAKNIMHLDNIYILLSTRNADMMKGISIPFICRLEDGRKGLLMFSREDYAKEYIAKHQLEVLDGVYPIGIVNKTDKVNGLQTIIRTANVMKVDFLDFNPGFNDNSLGCSISWFMEINKLSGEMSMLVSRDELEKMAAENDGNIPLRFHPIKINDFDNKYILDGDSSRAILQNVFKGDSFETYYELFSEESLFECCHTMDYIYTQMIPIAEKENKPGDVTYFKAIIEILEAVIKNKLSKETRLFTLVDGNTDEIVVKNHMIYILYTDRYKYMGQYKYVPIETIPELLEQTGVHKALVTDGPHGMALINFEKENA